MFSAKRVFLSICLIFAMFFSMASYCVAETTSNDAKVQEQREQLRKKINSLSRLERKESNKLNRNQQKLERNQQELNKSKAKYDKKQKNISKLQKELNSYLYQYNKRQKATSERIRCIYKTKQTLIFDLLISTDSISQFLDRVYYQNLIIQSDKKKMQELKTDAREVQLLKRQLELEKRDLSSIMRDINKENKSISKIIRQNKSMIQKIQRDKRAYERSERDLTRQSKNLSNMISKTTKDSQVKTTGGFILPVHGRISSPFGWRIHPIFKTKIFHRGIDYAAPMGTPIKASNSGKVIYSGWYGGYGRVVILDHGSSLTSLYAHMSRQKVVVGQKVQRGQIIGLVGATGYATGPHVHFEIRKNGKPQNPNNYL